MPKKNPETEKKEVKNLPQHIEAEQAVLGTVLLNNHAYEKVSEFLLPHHFAYSVHEKIYSAFQRLIPQGRVADPLTLKDYFDQDEELESIGGHKYLLELATSAKTVVNIEDYGRIVYDKYVRRELIDIGQEMVDGAYSGDIETSAEEQIELAEKKLFEISSETDTRKGLQDFSSALNKALENVNEAIQAEGGISGVSTGLRDLDKKLGGLHNSDLIILAGRPSMGKTALATNIAFNAAEIFMRNKKTEDKENKTVAFFSLEMSSDQLAGRILAAQAQVNAHTMRTGEMDQSEFGRLAGAVRMLEKVPLYIDDTPGLSVNAIRTRARRLKRTRGLGLIVIDYLQLISGAGGRKSDNRVQEVSEMTRGLKILAKELEVPVIVLSQLNRSVESRDDKRPQLSDLRESGSIEQDADVVMFVFREAYYLEREEPTQRGIEGEDKFRQRYEDWERKKKEKRNVAEVVLAKQRHGPIGIVSLYFNGEYTEFGDLINEENIPDRM